MQRKIYDWTVEREDGHPGDGGARGKAAAIVARIREIIGEGPVYLTFDIDSLDPAFAPGTGTPEIGGLTSWQAQAIPRGLKGLDFVGMDVVEVSPLRRGGDHRLGRSDSGLGVSGCATLPTTTPKGQRFSHSQIPTDSGSFCAPVERCCR